MMWQIRPTWAEIDLDRIMHNVKAIRDVIPGDCELWGVVKADGYGHGAVEVAQAALAAGVSRLAVSMVDEACELRKAGIASPILIMGYTPPDQGELSAKLGLSLTVYDQENAESLALSAMRTGRTLKLHLKVDTGMGRLGVQPEDALDFAQFLQRLPGCELEGVFTHFARADDPDPAPTQAQLRRFQHILSELRAAGIHVPLIHSANSAAAIRFPETHFSAVRLGIGMYGLYPHHLFRDRLRLLPAMALKTTVTNTKWVPPGSAIGYGGHFVTEAPTYIVTLPVGYGDGYTRLLTDKAFALLHGRRLPVIGNICMDQCMLDATAEPSARIGDEVVLWGDQQDASISVDELAEALGTINYEITCMISKRVPRVFLRRGQIVSVRTLLGR